MDLDIRHLFRSRTPAPQAAQLLPKRKPAPSNVANIGNEIYDSMLLSEKAVLRPPMIEEREVEVKPERRPGQSVYAGSLEP